MEQMQILKMISNAILVDYLAIFYIDLDTNGYAHFSKESESAGFCPDSDFFEDCVTDANRLLHEEDRETFIRALSKEELIRGIQSGSEELAEYRVPQNGEFVWYRIRIIKGEYGESGRYAILGVIDISEEKQKSEQQLMAEREREKLTQIASALANIFDSIYYVNLEDDSFIEFSSTAEYKKIRTIDSGSNFFVLAKPMLARFIHPNDDGKIRCIYDKDEMLRLIRENKGAYTTEYRFIIKGMIFYCRATMRVTKDGSHVLLCITHLGSEENIERKLMESERLSETFSQIAERLAENFDNIYYVNVATNAYMTFSSTKLLSELDKMERENNFFENVVKDIDQVIYIDDRAAVQRFFVKDELLASLNSQTKRQLVYRLLIDDEPNFVKLTAMLTKDTEHLLLCVENINDQVVKFRELTKKATCDELTGAKNKNAYKDFEQELNDRIDAVDGAEFAILVCDINNLKTINDTLGHNAGDRYIKNACRLICDTFVHSPVFRVGGDEFVAILKGSDYADRERLFEGFRSVAARNSAYEATPDKPVIASGMCVFAEKHKKVADVFSEADQMMYENKKRLKSTPETEL
ncbi:MAG: diguanylate cyclase [Ruminococcaceae bacterium]|nr:diguanylate cyclase [Oscillospiraceae bacterium]